MNSRKQPVELRPLDLRQARHLLRGQHARHEGRAGRMMRVQVRHLLTAPGQPFLHHLDFVGLRQLDALRQLPDGVAAAVRGHQRGHVERLRVMADHPLHEADVGRRERHFRQVRGGCGIDDPAVLPGRAWLDDLRTCGRRRCGTTPPPARRATARRAQAFLLAARFIRLLPQQPAGQTERCQAHDTGFQHPSSG